MAQKLISMIEKELIKHSIIKDLINEKINGTDASKMIGVTVLGSNPCAKHGNKLSGVSPILTSD